jgi:hypothetical protein
MRILVYRIERPSLAGASDHRTGYPPPLFRLRSIGLLDCPHDERTYRDTRGLGALFQPLMQ